MILVFRRCVLFLAILALVGGATLELAQSVQYGPILGMDGTPCDMTMPASALNHTSPIMPCKGMTPGCVKMMGCAAVSALPAHFMIFASPARYGAIDYWTSPSALAGLDLAPELLPPRTT